MIAMVLLAGCGGSSGSVDDQDSDGGVGFQGPSAGGTGGDGGGAGSPGGEGGAGGGAPGVDGGGSPPVAPPSRFCPPYVDAPEYRPRARTLELEPSDDWLTAIQDAGPDTEVLLADGEYRLGDAYAVLVREGVTLRSRSGRADRVVLRGQGYGPDSEGIMVLGADVTVAELTVTQTRNHAIAIKAEQGATRPQIYGVELRDIGTQHVKLSPGASAEGLVACSHIGYSPGAVKGDYVNAIDLHNAVDWTIRDNVIYNIAGDGTGCEVDRDCGSYISGPAILVWNDSRGTIIERNRLLGNFRNIALGLDRGHTGGVVRNNFIWRDGPGDAGIELRSASGTRVLHNTVYVGDYPGAVEVSNGDDLEVAGNFLSAPVVDRGGASFVAHENLEDLRPSDLVMPGDPHLAPTSRARGLARARPEVPDDIDLDPRAERADVGADQVHVE